MVFFLKTVHLVTSRRSLLFALMLALLMASLGHVQTAYAITLPDGFAHNIVQSGISSPTSMAFAPDGRIFVTEQGGNVRIIKNGSLLTTPFLTLSVDSVGERGLLGLAFDPSFTANNYLYVYYTVPANPRFNRVSRFTANGDVVLPGSEVVLMNLDNLSGATNHNGGALHFGPDGTLFIAVGENANTSNSQTLNNLLGKMLRINRDGSIPTSNPFYNQTTGQNRAIWALGLRNPFTFGFLPGSGLMYINDVGGGSWEEINQGVPGANYGWPETEGYTSDPRFVSPIYAYPHSQGCAITAGAFYSPNAPTFPESYVGDYFFADYCSNWIRIYDPATGQVREFATGTSFGVVDIDVGPDGNLYFLTRGGGAVHRIIYDPSPVPNIVQHPESQTVGIGQAATFTCSASGAQPLGYQWRRNGSDIPGATSDTYTLNSAQLSDNNAQFRCFVSNTQGSALSDAATLTVLDNQPPSASIINPTTGTKYNAGQTINFSGTGSDPETGALSASAFTWKIDFHHDTHSHPFVPPTSGVTNGSFTIPIYGETSANVWYRIYLTVTDVAGLKTTIFRDVLPNVATLTFNTVPNGLQVTLDGQPQTTPFAVQGVVGVRRTIGAVNNQNIAESIFTFNSWSNGGAANQEIATPATNTTYTANYRVSRGPSNWIGVFRPSSATFLLRNATTTGPANIATVFGIATDVPLAGDWNGDGVDTIGVYRSSTGQFFLRNSNSAGAPLAHSFAFGAPGDAPVVGDWDGNGTETVGVFRAGRFYLRNTLNAGLAHFSMTFGASGDVPVAGDWDGNGIDSPGVFRAAAFHLTNQVCSCTAAAAHITAFGATGDLPFVGDWDADGVTGLGVFRPSVARMFLRNDPKTSGGANITLTYGANGDKPLAGAWTTGAFDALPTAPTFEPPRSSHKH